MSVRTSSTDDRFSGDQILRQYGFVIDSRPASGPVTWRRLSDGKVFTDREARRVALAMRAKSLKELERK